MAEGSPYSINNLPPLLRLADVFSPEIPFYHLQSQTPQKRICKDGLWDEGIEVATNIHAFTNEKIASREQLENSKGNTSVKATNVALQNEHSSTRKRKTWQECSLCANHKVTVAMKGHKSSCPYLNCPCEVCVITRKKNYYSKEHQKYCRLRQEQIAPSRQGASGSHDINFPENLRQEMEKDMSDGNLDILDKINSLCMPKFKH